MEAVGLSALGQCSWQLWCEWQAWQPPAAASAASRSRVARIAHVVDQRPGAVERGRAQIVLVPAHRIAGRIAHGAIDALDGGVGGDARRGCPARSARSASARVLLGANAPLAFCHFSKNGGHVAGEVLDDRQVGERADLDAAVLDHLRDVRAAGPARAAVDRHGAAAAHADPAGEAVGERRVGVALHPGHHVEHGLVLAQRHGEGL